MQDTQDERGDGRDGNDDGRERDNPDGRTGYLERRYRILVAGYAISSYGSYLNMVALNLYVYAVTERALAVGVFLAVRLGAGFVAGMLAGPILARWPAKAVMFWVNVVQAATLVVLVTAPDGLRSAALFFVSASAGVTGTVFSVALRSAVVPEMVGQERRTWANSLMVSWRSMAMVVGFASAGVVVSLLGYTAAFLVDMVTFLVCAGAVALLPGARDGAGAADEVADGAGLDGAGADGPADGVVADGVVADAPKDDGSQDGGDKRDLTRTHTGAAVVALAAAPVLGLMVLLRAVDALGSSSHNAALPVYSTQRDHHDPAVFVSVFWCVWALGNVLVQQVIQRYTRRSGRAVGALGFGLGTIAMSAAFILAFAGLPWAATVVIALLAGAADGLTEVSYTSHLQTLPDALRTPAFGLSATVENFGFGVGMIAVGAALDAFSPLAVVAVAHGAAIVVAVVYVGLVLRQRVAGVAAGVAGVSAGSTGVAGGTDESGEDDEGVRGAGPTGAGGPACGGRRDGAEVPGS
ncbi:major facilitator superfamily MFS_1 [Actinobacteria bacterium OK074]|nr:major facilitator superfamily MFS_1 [Actinobacteria bacterium OK074]